MNLNDTETRKFLDICGKICGCILLIVRLLHVVKHGCPHLIINELTMLDMLQAIRIALLLIEHTITAIKADKTCTKHAKSNQN